MAGEHPAQFLGMLPPFLLTEDAAPTTLQASNPIPALPPAGGVISQDPALQIPVNSKFQAPLTIPLSQHIFSMAIPISSLVSPCNLIIEEQDD